MAKTFLLAGNRTLVSRLASEHSATKPPTLPYSAYISLKNSKKSVQIDNSADFTLLFYDFGIISHFENKAIVLKYKISLLICDLFMTSKLTLMQCGESKLPLGESAPINVQCFKSVSNA